MFTAYAQAIPGGFANHMNSQVSGEVENGETFASQSFLSTRDWNAAGPTTNQLASSASREDIQQVGVAFSKTTRTFVQKADPMLRLLIS